MKCPTCKKERERFTSENYLPFCSERCKQADFGRWLAGEYAVSRPLSLEDESSIEEILLEEETRRETAHDE